MDAPDLTDLRELVALIEFRILRTRQVYEPNAVLIDMKDPTWPFDWQAMLERYSTAKNLCVGLDPSTVLPDVTPTDANYEAVARSVQQVANAMTKGDLADLMARLTKVGYPVNETGAPQPKKTFSDRFTYYTNAVPTPKELFDFTKLALLALLAWKLGFFDRKITVRQR